MKKRMNTAFLLALCCFLTGCSGSGKSTAFPVIMVIAGLLCLISGILRTRSWALYNRKRARSARPKPPLPLDAFTYILYGLALLLLLLSLLGSCTGKSADPTEPTQEPTEATEAGERAPSAVPAVQPAASADPSLWGIRWEIFENGVITHSYDREEPIFFGAPDKYFSLPGVAAFRGNNFRNSPAYGTAAVKEKKLTSLWTVETTTLPGTTWSGSGWTGQPLVVKWDKATRQNMNLYPEKKSKDDLVEVIYATLGGNIYFLDMEDGSYTRDPIDMGMCFKGAGSLDPRGYPLLYVGSGDANSDGKRPRMFIISLIDGKVLYENGYNETLSYRKDNDNWCAFDSSPLVDAETDTLIWPGESGVLYTIKLNSNYDKAAGTVTISPDTPVVTRYLTNRTNYDTYWAGYEASADIVDNYLYTSENGGMFYCIDLNTMELVWAQDTKDDSNSSPVFEADGDNRYVYTAPSLHWTRSSEMTGSISLYKLDALTGEILWEKPYSVHTIDGVSGGVQSTPVLGKPGTSLEGLIIYTIARIPNVYSGKMVALDTKTGEEVWSLDMTNYTWSSPIALYTESGDGYVVVFDAAGYATLVEGKTGKTLYTIQVGGLIEASPVAYNNTLIIGTRDKKICGVKIS